MKKKWIWVLSAVALVAAAFFLPRFILTVRQNEARHRVATQTVEDNFSESGNMSMAEKLQLLCSDTAQTLYVDTSYDLEAIQVSFDAQLDTLIDLGAFSQTIPVPTDAASREILAVNPVIVMETDKLLRCYEIFTASFSAVMDMDTGKLYALYSWDQTEYAMEETYVTMQMKSAERAASGTAAELAAWAAYYGLEMSEITFDDQELPDANGNWNLASCLFYDAAGNTVGFALSNNYANYTIGWRCINAELASYLRDLLGSDSSQEVGQ
ncbi:MAG: hypothetical protein IJ357_02150 [Oscillospiraceae bacterium]|nr:hypothetical protein [Oscillospiraceae bacterium]